jgi:hypothetical protein
MIDKSVNWFIIFNADFFEAKFFDLSTESVLF